jgi:hypothetical protein
MAALVFMAAAARTGTVPANFQMTPIFYSQTKTFLFASWQSLL